MKPYLYTDPRTGQKYFLAEIPTDKVVNSQYNPRELKDAHKNDLKKSMETRGQLVPIIGHMSVNEFETRLEDVLFVPEEEA